MSQTPKDPTKINKADWPRTSDGLIDWEAVFENETNGLIPTLAEAKKPEVLIDCAAAITQALFARASDEDLRAGYTSGLAGIAMGNSDQDMETAHQQIADYLREIKDERIQRAADWASFKARQGAHNAAEPLTTANAATDAAADATSKPTAASATEPSLNDRLKQKNANETEVMFADIFCDELDQRFQVLWAGVSQELIDGRKIPFIVAADFWVRLNDIVRVQFMPVILSRCQRIISQAQRTAPEQRKEFLQEQLSGNLSHLELWETWKYAWSKVMQEAEIPEKPKTARKSIVSSLVKAIKRSRGPSDEQKMKKWQKKVKETKIQNATARENWVKLLGPSDCFKPPLAEDEHILMNMFSLTPETLRSQIGGLRQIVEQSANAGQAFDQFAKGKNLQLALIAVSYQNPHMFLAKKKLIGNMLRGMSKEERKQDMPLVLRYMADFI